MKRALLSLLVAALLTGTLLLLVPTPTHAQGSAPAAPTNLSVTAYGGGLRLTWTASTGSPTGYDVHYTSAVVGTVSNSATASGSDPATAWVDTSHSGTTASQIIPSLTSGTTYRVRVRGTNANGNSGWVFGSGTPAGPTALSVTAVTGSTVELRASWSKPVGPVASYEVRYKEASADDQTSTNGHPSMGWATHSTLLQDTSTIIPRLKRGTSYHVRVRAHDGQTGSGKGWGAWTATQTGTTGTTVAAATVALSASPAQVWEGQSSRITATLSHALPHDVSIPVHVSPCPENSWCRYLHSSKNRTILIFAGERTGSLRVPHPTSDVFTSNQQQDPVTDATVSGPYVSLLTFRDDNVEHEEVTVSLKSSLPKNVRAGGKTSQKVTVLDPDGFAMTLTADGQPAEGGDKVTLTVDLGQPAPAGFFAEIHGIGGTATPGRGADNPRIQTDWSMIPSPHHETTFHGVESWVTVLKDWNGASKKTVPLVINDDILVDPDETIVLRGTGYFYASGIDHGGSTGFPKGQLQSNELRLTIADNDGDAAADDPILVGTLDAYGREIPGADISTTSYIAVWLNRPASSKVTVEFNTEAGTATSGTDFFLGGGTVDFLPGQTRHELTYLIYDDNVEDSGETFYMVLSNPTGATLAPGYERATVTIINDEADLEGLKLWGASAADAPFAALDIGTFDRNKTNYAVTVPHGTTHAKIAGVEPQDAYLKLKAGIAGSPLTAVNSNAPSPAVALAEGDTILMVQATAPSGERKTYRVTVTREEPANGPPEVAYPIADLDDLRVGGARQVSLSGVFSYDGDGALTLTARSSDTDVADVTVAADQSALTVSGVAEGTATITVTADDGSSELVEDVFTVTVTAAPAGPEPANVQIVAGDGTATVSWTVSPFYYKGRLIEGERIMHALRWWVGSGWANPVGEKAVGRNDGIHVENGVTSYTITGLTNGVAVEANVRAFFGSNYQEGAMNKGESSTSSRWVSSGTATPTDPNQAPTVASAISDATIINESGAHQVSLSGVFTDADGDDLTVTATSSDEAVATASVSADYATLTVSAQGRGTATITVTADDGAATVEDTFTVAVKAAPTVASAIADVSGLAVDATHEVSLSGVFNDADGDSLTVTANSSNDAVATVAVAADYSNLTLTGKGAGAAAITVTAQDSDGNTVSDAFDVTVIKVNNPPMVSSAIADATIVNQSRTHQVPLSGVFTDADSDNLTITAESSSTSVATASVSADYATLTVSAQSRGTATVTVTAADGNGGSVEDTFTVTVKAAPVVASAIADVSELAVDTTHEVSMSGVFSDADGDALTISATTSDSTVAQVSNTIDPSTGSATAITVIGVAAGTATVTVTARDSDGNSVSDAFDVTVPAEQQQGTELPGPVVSLEVTASADNSVTVSWSAPETGGAPDSYIVHLRPEGGQQGSGTTKRPGADSTTVSFNNLESGQTYEVWVRAQNEVGKGERVNATITLPGAPPEPEGIPGPVIDLQLSATSDSVTVSWSAPETGGAPDNYIVHISPEDGGKGKTKTPKAKKTSVTFGNLQSGQTYQVWVRAQNQAGKGERTHASITLPE